MKNKAMLSAIAGAFILCGCSGMKIRNTGNSECEFRMHTDRERCLQNNKSNDEALAARKETKRDSKDSQATFTREEVEAAEGKRIP
jgi:hypothetical protein